MYETDNQGQPIIGEWTMIYFRFNPAQPASIEHFFEKRFEERTMKVKFDYDTGMYPCVSVRDKRDWIYPPPLHKREGNSDKFSAGTPHIPEACSRNCTILSTYLLEPSIKDWPWSYQIRCNGEMTPPPYTRTGHSNETQLM